MHQFTFLPIVHKDSFFSTSLTISLVCLFIYLFVCLFIFIFSCCSFITTSISLLCTSPLSSHLSLLAITNLSSIKNVLSLQNIIYIEWCNIKPFGICFFSLSVIPWRIQVVCASSYCWVVFSVQMHHLFKDICANPSFWLLQIELFWTFVYRILCERTFSLL